MSLKKYRKKRNFKTTPEPSGKIISTEGKNLYLIQKHAASHLHYDFRIELNGVLKSWAVPKGPCLDPAIKRLAMHVEDHPIEYGSFEGIIPPGQYGSGTVMLWDTGSWQPEMDNPAAQYHKGDLTFRLLGQKLQGRWKLIRIKNSKNSWLLLKLDDEYARLLSEFDITKAEPNSIISGRSLAEITEKKPAIWTREKRLVKSEKKSKSTRQKLIKIDGLGKKKAMPTLIKPQLATLVDQPPSGDNWVHEIKFDGYRLISFLKNKSVRMITRGNQDWTDIFSKVAAEIKKLPIKNAIFDGEIVVLDENQHSNFQLLQNSIKENNKNDFIYYIFDLLYLNDHDLSQMPLLERKKLLFQIIPATTDSSLRYSTHVLGAGEEIYHKSCEFGLEGVISKRIDSSYLQKRGKNWLKVKCSHRQEFVIGGFTEPKGGRPYFGSLLIGYYDKKIKKLIYSGHVGTGFNEKSLATTYELLRKNKTDDNPFSIRPPGIKYVTWVKPKFLAEVEFTEMTSEGILRHPSFKGLRMDKSAKEIILERPMAVKNVNPKSQRNKETQTQITHPEKILYPEQKITKLNLFEYYEKVSNWILPYINDRPLMILRCPNGYQAECFHQKHINKYSSKDLKGILIKEKDQENQTIYIDNKKGLLTLIQMGTLEIHIWGCKINHIDQPDIIVFDLDPAPDVKWSAVVAAAQLMRSELKKIKLTSFVKTTGGKGLHVVIPIKPEYDWEQIKSFSHSFIDYLVAQNPKAYIGTMTKAHRTGKIFLDYLRNQRGATAIAPYSTRARPDAPIAVPIAWDELSNNQRDTAFTIKDIFDRLDNLKVDPWGDFLKIKQSLKKILKK